MISQYLATSVKAWWSVLEHCVLAPFMLNPNLHALHFGSPLFGQPAPLSGTPLSHLHTFTAQVQHKCMASSTHVAGHTFLSNILHTTRTCTLGFLAVNAVPSVARLALLFTMRRAIHAGFGHAVLALALLHCAHVQHKHINNKLYVCVVCHAHTLHSTHLLTAHV